MMPAAVLGLIAIVIVGLVVAFVLSDDDDDMDLEEYNDWERLRGPAVEETASPAGRRSVDGDRVGKPTTCTTMRAAE
jgi:hypothetical protein